ncbi:MAG: hypothetical protein CW338_11350 [Clostridiales bacterium]|nr:hypothetical protein [Clostridiales bacterium]
MRTKTSLMEGELGNSGQKMGESGCKQSAEDIFPSRYWQRRVDENRPDDGENWGIAGKRWGKVDKNRPDRGKNRQKAEKHGRKWL